MTAADKALDSAEQYSALAGRAKALIEPVTNLIVDNVWLILIGAGAFIVWKSGVLLWLQVHDAKIRSRERDAVQAEQAALALKRIQNLEKNNAVQQAFGSRSLSCFHAR